MWHIREWCEKYDTFTFVGIVSAFLLLVTFAACM